MNITLLFLRVLKKCDETHPEHKNYEESTLRFIASYQRFRPLIKHKLIVVNCGSEHHDGLFMGLAHEYRTYSGMGYDCGTYQAVAKSIDADLIVGMNTHIYFTHDNWLEPFAYAYRKHGPGVYGAASSHERNPHLRTPFIAFSPSVMVAYPKIVNSRQDACEFEAGEGSFSLWAHEQGFTSMLVTKDGVYPKDQWRKPPNIFRRGDQSNCLVRDRHMDIYDKSTGDTRRILEQSAG
jgi:hypothetical protein